METIKPAVSYADQRANLLARLKRIEGQVQGLQRMVENDRSCIDILTQVAAVQSAIKQVGIGLLESHTRTCVTNAIKHGEDHYVDELMTIMRRFLK